MSVRKGMTLIEILVAIIVTSVTLSIGYVAFSILIDEHDRIITVTDDTARAAVLRRTLVSWLSGAHLAIDDSLPSFVGIEQSRGNTPNDEITFLTNSATPLDEDESRVRLYLQQGPIPAQRGLVVELQSREGGHMIRQVLHRAVNGMKIEYLTTVDRQAQWSSNWSSSTELPDGVRLTLLPDSDSLPALLRLPIVLRLDQVR